MSTQKKSLWQSYPARTDIFLYLLALIGLLLTAQLTPVLSIKKFVFWKSSYSLCLPAIFTIWHVDKNGIDLIFPAR